MAEAACTSHLRVVKWLWDANCPDFVTTMSEAARSGQFEVVKWLHARSCPWDSTVFMQAARTGNLDMMKWLFVNDCPWDQRTFAMAARAGYLRVLAWLRLKGCPLDSSVWSAAFCAGRRSVLMWLTPDGTVIAKCLISLVNKQNLADISPSGLLVACVDTNDTVTTLDARTGSTLSVRSTHANPFGIQFARSGAAAACTENKTAVRVSQTSSMFGPVQTPLC